MDVFLNSFDKDDTYDYSIEFSDSDSDDSEDMVLSSRVMHKKIALNKNYSHLLGNKDDIDEPVTIKKDCCCICGKEYHEHMNLTHRFFLNKDEYKCIKCGLFFYQHKHSSKQCNFTPKKLLQ
tara:strand:- start:1767 stop:2132 length:366 start_codon:yes stop_codon:yes gene_type:complete